MAKTEKLTFQLDQGETESFYVLEQTRLGGVDYLLVTDSEKEDGEALIMRGYLKGGRGRSGV